ncbi:DUF917 domain-containing protein [Parasalinivibrio latis]|uniref:DUF917 domain-containing protein n=1 Tax=Parasalinivibrio latis TaxID=2952610 RepID=UPI0030E10F6B
MRELTVQDIEAIEIGAAILGTGGGGNPYYGKLEVLEQLRQGRRIRLMPMEEIPDDALVISIGEIGAPAVSVEKINQGQELRRVVEILEKEVGRKVDAIISVEIGGANGIKPMTAAAQLDIPIVDGDGMGRAFPEMQMTTFSMYGHCSMPASMSDCHGNNVVFQELKDEYWLERLARTTVVEMGGSAAMAEAPMQGSFVKQFAVPGTVSQALRLGRAVMDANESKRNPIDVIMNSENGVMLFKGKIVDLERRMRSGFTVGQLSLQGLSEYQGEDAQIDIQNENLVFRMNGETIVSVPDLIVVLNIDTGHAITTDVLRYGQKVAVVGIPCHPLLCTPRALEVVGPAAFGYPEIEYRPLIDQIG